MKGFTGLRRSRRTHVCDNPERSIQRLRVPGLSLRGRHAVVRSDSCRARATVVRALEDAATDGGHLRSGDGVAKGKIGPATRLRVVDAILSGTAIAVRQHLYALQREGLVASEDRPVAIGRPAKFWRLTREADHLFPDAYAELSVALIDSVKDAFGEEGLERVLTSRCARQRIDYGKRIQPHDPLERKLDELAEVRSEEAVSIGAWAGSECRARRAHHQRRNRCVYRVQPQKSTKGTKLIMCLLCFLWRKPYLIPARDANLPLHESLYLERNAVSLCGANELSVDLEDAELH